MWQSAANVAAGAEEERKQIDARAAWPGEKLSRFVDRGCHEVEVGEGDRERRRLCAHTARHRLERFRPARIPRPVGEQQEPRLHRYRTSQLNAANDISM